MFILVEPFWIQKRGNPPHDYEDAASPGERREYEQNCVHIAVADGATESVFARRWAEELVNAVGEGNLSPHGFSEGISRLRATWHGWLAGKSLPWYAEEKARQGTFAALVALELTVSDLEGAQDGNWHAAAVGDSCLFHVRGEDVLIRFPVTTSDAFDNRPMLVSTVRSDEQPLNEANSSGTWKVGDTFYLMTDALACWFLKHIETGGSPEVIEGDFALGNDTDPFRAWVESLRDEGSIKNDDCTLIRVQIR